MQLDLNHLIGALSNTIDLVGVDELYHGKRVAYMADCCAASLNLNDDERLLLFRAGLLHDCGVSSTKVHKQLVDELDWNGSDLHCRLGAERLRLFAPLAPLSDIIRYHHTRWPELQDIPLPARTRRYANLIFLLDRVDALAGLHPSANHLVAKESILRTLNSLGESYFDPELVEILMLVSANDAFWLGMEPVHIEGFMATHSTAGNPSPIDLDGHDLLHVASLFGQIVDAKSRYTAEHSRGVASLSRFLAEHSGLAPATCDRIEAAGLLHDLGKLQVPDIILDFDGQLDQDGLFAMRHHSYVTYQILRRIKGFEDIARWAADHHEKLDGSGYPFRRTASELDIESRIIIIADIFQAMAQDRPYRSSQPVNTIVDLLRRGAESGQLDAELVSLVCAMPEACYSVAVGEG
ncbi:MAG: HD domain-containing protein [Desulforhopalus sp.]|nr:HD domain-containing protein [Desulforhopalus sp.]